MGRINLVNIWRLQICIEVKSNIQVRILLNDLLCESGLSLILLRVECDVLDCRPAHNIRQVLAGVDGVPNAAVPDLPHVVDVDWDGKDEDRRGVLEVRGQTEACRL